MVITIQDPGFFLNYVIVHCNFTCSVGVTYSQDLNQSANYKDGISPHLLSPKYFLPSPGLSFHDHGTFPLTSSLRAICVGREEVDGAVERGLLPAAGCRGVGKAEAEERPCLPADPCAGSRSEGRGWGRDLAKHPLPIPSGSFSLYYYLKIL